MTRPAGTRGVLAAALLGWFALVLALAGPALAAPKFPALTGRVVDAANVLSPQTETELTAELAKLETDTGRQVVVATIPDLQGYPIEDFGYQLGRAWGIGDKDRDDGVLLIVAPNDRKVRIEVGYGLEPVLTDTLSFLILQDRVLPAFRDGKIEAGVIDGTRAIIQQLSLPDDEAKAKVAQASQAQQTSHNGSGFPVIFVILIILWVIGGMMRGLGGRRRGGLWWLLPLLLNSSNGRNDRWGGGGWGGGGWGGGGGGGFGGGGGSFGGGGSSGSW